MRARGPGVAKTGIGAEQLDPDETGPLVRGVLLELGALLAREEALERHALISRSGQGGEARLIHHYPGDSFEVLQIRWNDSEIESIEIESLDNLSFAPPADPAATEQVIDALLPMLWRHIRRGRTLPEGIERFAGFLSLR